MSKRVLDVGNCAPDHATIRRYLTNQFDVEIVQAHGPEDTLQHLKRGEFHLVLINRKLDRDYSDGIEIIRLLKDDPTTADVPVMLVTNHAKHHDTAEAIGALRGFGKLEYELPETRATLAAVLEGE